jgi:hypothetical protein
MKIQGKKEKDYLTICLAVGLLGLILCDIVTVLRGSVEAFHSDSATAILLAREQLRSGQLIPEGWYYANDIWILSLNILCIPFMLFLKNWMLCRELAVILQLLIVTGLILLFVRKLAGLRYAIIAALLFWCPISVTTREHFLYQATYATGMMQTLLVLIAAYGFFWSEGRRKTIVFGGILGILTVIMAAAGIRFIGATVLPLAAAECILLLMENDFDLMALVKGKNLHQVIKVLFFLGMSGIGWIVHRKLRETGAISPFTMEFISYTNVWGQLSNLVYYYLSIWGCLDGTAVFSIKGILSFCNLVLCVIMNVVVPVYLIVRYRYIENRGSRFFIWYAFLTGIVLNYLVVFTNLYNNYYLLPIFFHSCILSGIALQDLFSLKKNLAGLLMGVCILPFCLLTGFYWASRSYSDGQDSYAMLEMLKEKGLYFGCSGVFWDTYKYTVLSDGEVEVVAYSDEPENPDLWLCSEKWYEPEYYEGKSFILIRNGWGDISDEWKSQAEEVISWGEFTIYAYPENIYKMIAEKEIQE